mmetsp:Transcript_14636/g.36421  ORF Transcript_14636/g.36421 Transcript_14636/m.36421 type:complete len:125 (-) Transcript_14636:365-739(-)
MGEQQDLSEFVSALLEQEHGLIKFTSAVELCFFFKRARVSHDFWQGLAAMSASLPSCGTRYTAPPSAIRVRGAGQLSRPAESTSTASMLRLAIVAVAHTFPASWRSPNSKHVSLRDANNSLNLE